MVKLGEAEGNCRLKTQTLTEALAAHGKQAWPSK